MHLADDRAAVHYGLTIDQVWSVVCSTRIGSMTFKKSVWITKQVTDPPCLLAVAVGS
jgi:hypothetical protein